MSMLQTCKFKIQMRVVTAVCYVTKQLALNNWPNEQRICRKMVDSSLAKPKILKILFSAR